MAVPWQNPRCTQTEGTARTTRPWPAQTREARVMGPLAGVQKKPIPGDDSSGRGCVLARLRLLLRESVSGGGTHDRTPAGNGCNRSRHSWHRTASMPPCYPDIARRSVRNPALALVAIPRSAPAVSSLGAGSGGGRRPAFSWRLGRRRTGTAGRHGRHRRDAGRSRSADLWCFRGAADSSDGGSVARWEGAAWGPSVSGATNFLYGVWGMASGDVWIVAGRGTVRATVYAATSGKSLRCLNYEDELAGYTGRMGKACSAASGLGQTHSGARPRPHLVDTASPPCDKPSACSPASVFVCGHTFNEPLVAFFCRSFSAKCLGKYCIFGY